jgi:DNA topoisomerase-2
VIKDYIKSYFEGTSSPELKPSFNGFKGSIEQGENKNQWLITGTFEIKSNTEVLITEIPIGYTLKSYTKVLDDLEDKKVIKSFEDLSENDEFKFLLKTDMKFTKQNKEIIIAKLKLQKKITENFTVIDENNRVGVFDSAADILDSYIEIKLRYMSKRKEYLIQSLTEELKVLASKYLFIKGVTENEIIVNKKSKAEIQEQLEHKPKIQKHEDSYDYLLKMPIYSLTEEKMNELLSKIQGKKEELNKIKEISERTLWFEDIERITDGKSSN